MVTKASDIDNGQRSTPCLSVIVIAYRMPRQLELTLRSLSSGYQRNVCPEQYEVIVIENESDELFNPALLDGLEGQFRYIRRKEPGVSPAAAINHGLAEASGKLICLMIDGARIVSPGLIYSVLQSAAMAEYPLISVPAYILGFREQYEKLGDNYEYAVDQALLESIDWYRQGYKLFDIAHLSGANGNGFFHPAMESNCITVRKDVFAGLGGADQRFNLKGGGMLNLDIYRQLLLLQNHRLFLVFSEGTFHQYHGGTTTSGQKDQSEFVAEMQEQYLKLRGEAYKSVLKEPTIIGTPKSQLLPWLSLSCELGIRRFQRFRVDNKNAWPE